MSIDSIDKYVAVFSISEIEQCFSDYDNGCFDHLLRRHRNSDVDTESKRKAVGDYLTQTLFHEPSCERQTKFLKCIQTGTAQDFIRLIRNDQYFSEPLMHTLNQGKRNYNLKLGKENYQNEINN